MKRVVFIFSVLGLAVFLFSSCQKTYTLGPLPAPVYTPTFTSTSTPTVTPTPTTACGFWNPGTPTPTSNWTPLPTPFCPLCPAPVTTFSQTPFNGTVIRSLTDWQAAYGNSPPPPNVNFATDMILVKGFLGCCYGSQGFLNVCETATAVEITLYDRPWRGQVRCWAYCFIPQQIVVPQSNLPVVITETVTY